MHKNEKRLGMIDDLSGEHSAMQRYSSGQTTSISRTQSSNVFFNDEDVSIYQSFRRAIFWSKVKLDGPKPNESSSENSNSVVAFKA